MNKTQVNSKKLPYSDKEILFLVESVVKMNPSSFKLADKLVIIDNYFERFGKVRSVSSIKMFLDNVAANLKIPGYENFGLGNKKIAQFLSNGQL